MNNIDTSPEALKFWAQELESDPDALTSGDLQRIAATIRALAAEKEALEKQEPVGWINEDELPESYPYAAMFPHSRVDFVRMFPVYAPQPAPSAAQVVPQGWIDAVRDAAFDEEGYTLNPDLAEVHASMLAAAPQAPAAQPLSDEQIDEHLDVILRASGSTLRHFTMHKTLSEMRAAMRNAIEAAHGITGAQGEGAGS
jgi:hypothetical protein